MKSAAGKLEPRPAESSTSEQLLPESVGVASADLSQAGSLVYQGWKIVFTGRNWMGKWADSWDAEYNTDDRALTHMHPGRKYFSSKQEALRCAIGEARCWINTDGRKWASENNGSLRVRTKKAL
ncbi:MAG TPA: hypothetical protein VGQ81_07600 [Acidobacteriota bacterium]|nr:hypothetical protein [Acidobacteriota bacterium]